jgi:hypothetical protein
MSTVSGGQHFQPPVPGPQPSQDVSEPVGSDLGDAHGDTQPPVPLVRPGQVHPLGPSLPGWYAWDPPSAGQAITGLVLTLVGAVTALVMPPLVGPFAVAGTVISLIALVRCQLRRARGRLWALAGLVLGITEIALVLLMWPRIIAWMTDIPG